MENCLYELIINVDGRDVKVQVGDLETANILLNDHAAAEQYVRNGLGVIVQNLGDAEEDHRENEVIWIRKRPSENDLNATSELINLRTKFDSEFNNKTTPKLKVWEKIARELKLKYNLGEGSGAIRCRQKWANLIKPVISYIENQKKTGSAATDVPPFFDEIFSVIGDKHKVQPKYLLDSFERQEPCLQQNITLSEKKNEIPSDTCVEYQENEGEEKEEQDEVDKENEKNQPSCSKVIDRFRTARKQNKPKSTTKNLEKYMEDQVKLQNSQFNFLKDHLNRSAEQRDRFLNIVEKSFRQKRKRKRSETDSDTE